MRFGLLALPLVVATAACEKQPAYIKVKAPQASVQSTRADPVIPPFARRGDTIKLRASAFYKDDSYMGPPKQVKWESTDPSVATVGLDGLVEITGSGDTKIKATTVGYEQALSADIAIKASIIKKIELLPPAEGLVDGNKLNMGEEVKFIANVYDDKGKIIKDAKVKWRTSGYAATIGVAGTVEGRAIGETQVVAEAGPETARFDLEVLDWKKPEKKRRRRR